MHQACAYVICVICDLWFVQHALSIGQSVLRECTPQKVPVVPAVHKMCKPLCVLFEAVA